MEVSHRSRRAAEGAAGTYTVSGHFEVHDDSRNAAQGNGQLYQQCLSVDTSRDVSRPIFDRLEAFGLGFDVSILGLATV